MGAPRRRFALLSVEPLEERSLLSALGYSAPAAQSLALASLGSMPSHSVNPASLSKANDSPAQQPARVQVEVVYSPSGHPSSTASGVPAGSAAIHEASLPAASSGRLDLDAGGPYPDNACRECGEEGGYVAFSSIPAAAPDHGPSRQSAGRCLGGACSECGADGPAACAVRFLHDGRGGRRATGGGDDCPADAPLSCAGGIHVLFPEGEEVLETGLLPAEFLPAVLPVPAAVPDSPPVEASSGSPIADVLPIDVEAIGRSLDAFLDRLASLSQEWIDGPMIEKLTPWCMAVTVVAFEWARLRRRRGCCWDEDSEAAALLIGE